MQSEDQDLDLEEIELGWGEGTRPPPRPPQQEETEASPQENRSRLSQARRLLGRPSPEGPTPRQSIPERPPPSAAGSTGSYLSDAGSLADLIAYVVEAAADLATLVLRRRLGLDLSMRHNEAMGIAKPIARIVQRRVNVRGDLAEATDVAGVGGGVMSWLKRLLTSQDTMPAMPGMDGMPARPAPPTSFVHGTEPARPVAQPPSSPAQPEGAIYQPHVFIPPVQAQTPSAADAGEFADRGGSPVPGSGPAKAHFLAGFEEPPHQ